jgi:hypothetical protein
MAITDANKTPIYSIGGDNSTDSGTTMASTFTTAAADYTGATATHNKLVFTAGANGSFVQRLRFKAIGTNTASVARVFINNGSTNATAANNVFYGEISLPATTAIATAATVEIDYPMNFALTPNFRIYVGLGTTVAAGWVCFAVAGEY